MFYIYFILPDDGLYLHKESIRNTVSILFSLAAQQPSQGEYFILEGYRIMYTFTVQHSGERKWKMPKEYSSAIQRVYI
jgi:hypothetical protein